MAVGLHSALAINRQRKRRNDNKRARDRRYSSASAADFGSQYSISGTPRGSICSDGRGIGAKKKGKNKYLSTGVVGSVSTFHIGVVFIILGLFLIVSSLVPDYITDEWGELLGTGIFFLCVGIFLIILNRLLTKHEDEVLFKDVQSKLSRSRSGQRLVRDAESGAMTAVSTIRAGEKTNQTPKDSPASTAKVEKPSENEAQTSMGNGTVATEQPEAGLGRIAEECEVEHHGNHPSAENGNAVHCTSYNSNESASLSPTSPNETQGLLHSKHSSRV